MIHPSAVVSNNAEIDKTTNIGPFCIIGDGVKIGKASALLAASVFHYKKFSIEDVKRYLNSNGVNVRI